MAGKYTQACQLQGRQAFRYSDDGRSRALGSAGIDLNWFYQSVLKASLSAG